MQHNDADRLKQLRQRHQNLRDRRIRDDAELQRLDQALASEIAEAERQFGTSDPDKLRAMLTKMEADNAKALDEFERAVSSVEAGLASARAT